MSFWKKDKPHLLAASRQMADQGISPESISSSMAISASTDRPAPAAAFSDSKPLTRSQPELVSFEQRYGSVKTALSAGTVIDGRLSFDVAVRIDGKLNGELYSSQAIIIGPEASISASIEAPTVVIFGHVKGSVIAGERVEIQPGGILEADIVAPVFTVVEGAIFNGKAVKKAMPQAKAVA